MAIVIKPPLFPRHPYREAIPLHMVCQDLYSVFKVLFFGTIILSVVRLTIWCSLEHLYYIKLFLICQGVYQKIFLGNFYQSLNLKEVCIIVVLVEGLEPSILFRQSGLSGLWMPVPTHQHKWCAYWESNPDELTADFESALSTNSSIGAYKVPFH